MHPALTYPAESITVIPWGAEGSGHDPRSGYVEETGLGSLGPTATFA